MVTYLQWDFNKKEVQWKVESHYNLHALDKTSTFKCRSDVNNSEERRTRRMTIAVSVRLVLDGWEVDVDYPKPIIYRDLNDLTFP